MADRTVSFRELLETYEEATAPLEVTLMIASTLPSGERVDVEMSPDFIPNLFEVLALERKRVIESIQMEQWLENGPDSDAE